MPDLNWKGLILEITARENRIQESLNEAFVTRDSHLWKNLYISLVKPHLEYAAQVWCRILQKPSNELRVN